MANNIRLKLFTYFYVVKMLKILQLANDIIQGNAKKTQTQLGTIASCASDKIGTGLGLISGKRFLWKTISLATKKLINDADELINYKLFKKRARKLSRIKLTDMYFNSKTSLIDLLIQTSITLYDSYSDILNRTENYEELFHYVTMDAIVRTFNYLFDDFNGEIDKNNFTTVMARGVLLGKNQSSWYKLHQGKKMTNINGNIIGYTNELFDRKDGKFSWIENDRRLVEVKNYIFKKDEFEKENHETFATEMKTCVPSEK